MSGTNPRRGSISPPGVLTGLSATVLTAAAFPLCTDRAERRLPPEIWWRTTCYWS